MASCKFLYNEITGSTVPPRPRKAKFQAGATQAIAAGDILELTGAGTTWVPMDSEFSMSGNVCVAAEDVLSGDRAGLYNVMFPRPGDVWEVDYLETTTLPEATPVKWSSTNKVSSDTVTYVLGRTVGQDSYPRKQYHLSQGEANTDPGTTIGASPDGKAHIMFKESVSAYSTLQV